MSKADNADIPALLIRLAVGPMLVTHGVNKVAGGGGLDGTAGWFEAIGLKPGWLHARLAAATEIGAGVLLTLGALNPLPSAAVIGLMTVAAATDHRGKGFFVFKGGWEYTGVLGVTAVALASLGHGRLSVDRLVGNKRRGLAWGLAAAGLGVGNALAILGASYRPQPKVEAEADSPSDEAA